MRGLSISFTTPGACTVSTGTQVSGFEATVQNAMVNLGTDRGTDKVYQGKGTELLQTAVRDGLPGARAAQHAANFAAVDTLFFSRETDLKTEDTSLQGVSLVPDMLTMSRASFAASFQSIDGRTIGLLPATFVNQG